MEKKPLIRYANNPILSKEDIPYESLLAFNAGVIKYQGKYVMMFRNDWGDHINRKEPAGAFIGLAFSDNGLKWEVQPSPCFTYEKDGLFGACDPRITVIENRVYLSFAINSKYGVHGGIAVTDDFEKWDILSLTAPDNRNIVMFPEKINGRFARLERPMPVYSRIEDEAFDIWYSESPDCNFWGNLQFVLGTEHVPYANVKIGPGAPPIKTEQGWLATIHAVDYQEGRILKGWEPQPWTKRYTFGLVLLDLEKPWIVKSMSKEPLLLPEMDYELEGYRGSVLFPGGMILEDNGEVKIYYGAADTVECLATAQLDELLDFCKPIRFDRLKTPKYFGI